MIVFEINGLAVAAKDSTTKGNLLLFLTFQFTQVGDEDLVVQLVLSQRTSNIVVPYFD